ncbi:Pre-mRNA-splicing factor cef1, partial [Linderina pennispora]
MASRGLREQLARKLASLPKPKNEFEVVVPDVEVIKEEIQVGPSDAVEDQTDIESRLAKEREEREEAELRRRSKPVQLNLPRPDALSSEILAVSVSSGLPPSVLELISSEMRSMILSDARRHPVPNAPVLRGARSADAEVEDVSDDLLEQARAMVATEIEQNMPQETKELFESAGKVHAATAWATAERSETWLPAANKYVATSEISNGEWIEKYSVELAQHRKLMATEAARATKAERKLGITLGGYQARAKALTDKIITAHKDFEQAKLDSEAFASLYTAEQAAIPARIEKAEEELKRVQAREGMLQAEYQAL